MTMVCFLFSFSVFNYPVEYGYSHRVVDLIIYIAKKDAAAGI